MEVKDLSEYFAAGKGAIELLKAAYAALPSGAQRDKIEAKVRTAEDMLNRSDAKLARDLGYRLCQCTFPPQIMLWREPDKAWVCRNEACGAKIELTRAPDDDEDDWIKARR